MRVESNSISIRTASSKQTKVPAKARWGGKGGDPGVALERAEQPRQGGLFTVLRAAAAGGLAVRSRDSMDELAAATVVEATSMLVDEDNLNPAGGDAGSHADIGMSVCSESAQTLRMQSRALTGRRTVSGCHSCILFHAQLQSQPLRSCNLSHILLHYRLQVRRCLQRLSAR